MTPEKPLSYTQNLEDYHLWLAFAGAGPGFYIDVGGGHPVADNVSMWFYERGWRGHRRRAATGPRRALRPRPAARHVFEGLVGRTDGRRRRCTSSTRLHGLSTTVRANASRRRHRRQLSPCACRC